MSKKKTTKIRIRKSVFTLGKPGDDLDWYANGVAELKKRPLTDPTSWRYLAAVHGAANDPFATPGEKTPSKSDQQRFWNQCRHQSWYFLPWHRGYLACFEEIIAATVTKLGGDPGWALPYWNYCDTKTSNARCLPAAFLGGGTANPLFLAERNMTSPSAQLPVGHTNLDALLHSPFSVATAGAHPGFGGPETGFSHIGGTSGLLENLPHNIIHDDVGGLMSDPDTAALDPIFWQADLDCLRYGLVHGTYCVASCWAMMLAAMLAAHAWLAMLCMQVIAMEERREREPPVAGSGIALLGCSVLSAIAAW